MKKSKVKISELQDGEKFSLTIEDVHEYGKVLYHEPDAVVVEVTSEVWGKTRTAIEHWNPDFEVEIDEESN